MRRVREWGLSTTSPAETGSEPAAVPDPARNGSGTPPALEVSGLWAGYTGTAVLRGVDLVVDAGVTSILGSSGCGKTTLLRSVAGFVEPTDGIVRVAGREVTGKGRAVPPRDRRVGYVPQEGALFPHLSVAGNVAFGLSRRERRTASARVTEALELVELDPALADRLPQELSGGQQQRVALARALAPRPGLVLLDEPFASLDASLREETGRAVVRALRAADAAAVLVTHDQGEALSLADQVAVMAEGRIVQVDTPPTVHQRPADPGVAAFLGHATVLDGTVDATGCGHCPIGRVRVGSATTPGPARFVVRSEQLQVGAADMPGTLGEVVDVSFYGHDATVRIRLESGEQVIARTLSTTLPRPGQRVSLSVLGDVVAFDA